MALVPKEIEDRIAALEERLALIEEALAPKDNRIKEKEDGNSIIGQVSSSTTREEAG